MKTFKNSDLSLGFFGVWFATIAFVVLVVFLMVGPAGLSNQWTAWKASAYGSDWLVVQYAQDGSIIAFWELEDAAIENESHSDGIYFTSEGSVKHLSGHYIYVQNPTEDDRDKLMKGRVRKFK